MHCYEDKCFLGEWNLDHEKGTLSVEKTGETYKCVWKINKKNTHCEYLGIGMLVDSKLYVARSLNQVPGGIGMYKPIGDLRSNSALWASTQNFNTLGSGIALREDTSESFEGNYKVRYFINGYECPVYDLKIIKRKQSDNLYDLNWAEGDVVKLHGIGMTYNGQMVLAWGGIDFEYEVVILSISDEGTLNGKCALLSSSNITEEIYTK